MDEVFVGQKGLTIGIWLQDKIVYCLTQSWTCSDHRASHWRTRCLSDGLSSVLLCCFVFFFCFFYINHQFFNWSSAHLSYSSVAFKKHSGGVREASSRTVKVISMLCKMQQHLSTFGRCLQHFPWFSIFQYSDMWRIFFPYMFIWIWGCEMQQLNIQQMVILWLDWWELVRGMLIAKQDEIFPSVNSCPKWLHY